MADVRFLLSGDSSVTVEFGNEISPAINAQIRAFNIALEESKLPGITETVPTYRSLMVHYDPGVIRYDALVKEMKGLLGQLSNIQIPPSDVLEIPVLYGGEYGPDLDFVAEHNHKTPEEVVKIHTSTEYLIYMLGFTPGFIPGRHERGDRHPPAEAAPGEDPRRVGGHRRLPDRRVPHRLPGRLAAHRPDPGAHVRPGPGGAHPPQGGRVHQVLLHHPKGV